MGKDWYWAGSKSSKSKRGRTAETEIPSGCMCAVFQAFDFHPFTFSINQHQQSSFNSANIPQDLQSSVPKGAEAPRNSLESEDGTVVSSISKEEKLKVPKNIRTKTSGNNTRARAGNLNLNDISSEIISSPGTKTPTLVARLMGLDLLPDANSSSSSSSSCLSTPNQLRPRQHIQVMKHRNSTGSYNNNAAIRSLHETPRRSDVEHRLSLQINKENMGLIGEDFDLPRFSFSKRKYDENNYSKSPSHYARQIVKQVKESVSRKVGLDITNTVKSRDQENKKEFVGQIKFKKSLKTSVKSQDENSPRNPSYSPRLSRFMDSDTKNKSNTTKPSPLTPKDQNTHPKQPSPPPVVNIEAQVSRVLTQAKPQAFPEQELQNQKPVPKCKKNTNEKFSSRLNKVPQTSSIRKKQEEAFIIRPPPSPTRANDIKTKSKRTHPLPNNLLNNLHTVPNLLPVKTDPSPPATKIPQKQSQVSDTREPKRSTQVSSCSRQRYKQETTHTLVTRGTNHEVKDKSNGDSTTTGADAEGPEFQYIATILERTGPHKATVLQPHFHFQWFSLFHPLDPSIFHHLEQNPTSNSTVSSLDNDKDNIFTQKNHPGPRCNRRLLFDLVDEVLSEILVRPKYCYRYRGMLLLETVWNRVRSFPRAKCEVLEDIDRLIEIKEEEEEREGKEGLVAEIEGNILETLVHETVTVMVEMKCVRT